MKRSKLKYPQDMTRDELISVVLTQDRIIAALIREIKTADSLHRTRLGKPTRSVKPANVA